MKLLKKLFGFLSLVLIIGGAFVLFWEYFRNKQLFVVLLSNSIVKGSIGVLQKMGLAIIAIIAGLIMFVIYMRLAGAVRRNEREKREALREAQKESEETQRQLKKEAEAAKAEAEKVKKENELMKMTFMRKPEEGQDAQPEPQPEPEPEPEKEGGFFKNFIKKMEGSEETEKKEEE
jgi:uncharacterized membrane protein (DUF106 family)